MSDFKPGQIAKATVRGVPDVTVMHHEGGGWFSAAYVASWRNHNNRDVTDVRPLVVLDPSDPAVAEFVKFWKPDGDVSFAGRLALLIEAQTRPAIEEPKGLGAVVRDRDGVVWQRIDANPPWFNKDRFDKYWRELDVAEALSPGWLEGVK